MKFFLRFFIFVGVIILLVFGFFFLKTEGKDVSRKLENGMSATFIEKDRPQSTRQQTQTQVNYAAIVDQAATIAGVKVLSFENYGSSQDVLIEWRGSNNQRGADFVDNILKQGHLRDFQDSPAQITKNSRGETIYKVTYRLYMQ